MYTAEFGDNGVDEINFVKPGLTYGRPMVEGTGDTQGGRFTNPLLDLPVTDASPSGIAISGDTLYMTALSGERL